MRSLETKKRSTTPPVSVRLAGASDAAEICDIYNLGIQSGQATFDTNLRNLSDIEPWFDKLDAYPVIVAECNDRVVGFARLFEYRPRACYRQNTEFSIYLADSARGLGVGTTLLSQLTERARSLGYRKVLSRIFTFNQASLALCAKLGFREVGVYEQHGQVNGQWLDVVIVEKLL
jgi:L-amino acid N-acyltransferase YncA